MKHFAIFEKANDGQIWARFVDIDGIIGRGTTVGEARASLLVSVELAVEADEVVVPASIVAVEELELGISA